MIQRLALSARPLPSQALAMNRDKLKALAQDFGLSNVRVFGSAVRGVDKPGSDLDLLVTRGEGIGLLTISAFAEAAGELLGIGENVARLSPETTKMHPDVPWSLIKGVQNRLAHHYEATDYQAVWDTLVGDLPVIRAYIESILDE